MYTSHLLAGCCCNLQPAARTSRCHLASCKQCDRSASAHHLLGRRRLTFLARKQKAGSSQSPGSRQAAEAVCDRSLDAASDVSSVLLRLVLLGNPRTLFFSGRVTDGSCSPLPKI
ncbi:hypothetical protein ABZP36_011140 [Zizania latifolia]